MAVTTKIIDFQRKSEWDEKTTSLALQAFSDHGHFVLRNANLVDARNPIPLLKQIFPHNLAYHKGTSDRSPIVDNVYTATKAPFFLTLPLHSETSYSADYPEVFVFLYGANWALGWSNYFRQ